MSVQFVCLCIYISMSVWSPTIYLNHSPPKSLAERDISWILFDVLHRSANFSPTIFFFFGGGVIYHNFKVKLMSLPSHTIKRTEQGQKWLTFYWFVCHVGLSEGKIIMALNLSHHGIKIKSFFMEYCSVCNKCFIRAHYYYLNLCAHVIFIQNNFPYLVQQHLFRWSVYWHKGGTSCNLHEITAIENHNDPINSR